MSQHRILTQQETGSGTRFEVYEIAHLTRVLERRGGDYELVQAYTPAGRRQVKISLEGGGALLEPGALQYAHGNLRVAVQQQEQGGFLARAVRSAGTGESAFATRYEGYGEVWTEPTAKHFLIASMEGPGDALLLDDRAFYACESSIQLKTHTHRSVSGVLSGNGLVQPRLEGRGVFVVESPVPAEEVEAVEIGGGRELIVDGDLLLMYSASLQVELRPLVRGLRNAARSGEGLVYVLRGEGVAWLTPTARGLFSSP
ncbi:uncharacterized protein (AIM24 family) [Deinobacterium chartae]|uniref:Uncharacterized protein (AIM24 family) n=1 Tax=Deinobacterium chartae TaxID=521158 RepID=A0A841HX33_9DEIO|nr:AIM24 family protein [Deinobacterium chartae]MBB6097204.1 uncharacterized protein (AIM24 family) [Deinobacterium chartae]